jgi:hypothetical protein
MMRLLLKQTAFAIIVLLGINVGPYMQDEAQALAGCCVCKECPSTDLCDEQQTGAAQCRDFCEQQGCDEDETIFVGGAPNTCANGCDGNFGGGGTPAPTTTPTGTPANTPIPTSTRVREMECNDGMDNDNDNDIDCQDFDCIGQPECTEVAPAMAPPRLLILSVLLVVVGLLVMSRRRLRTQR